MDADSSTERLILWFLARSPPSIPALQGVACICQNYGCGYSTQIPSRSATARIAAANPLEYQTPIYLSEQVVD